jgi:uncharacterized protein YuzE
MRGSLRLPPPAHVWVDYDQEADVFYLSFRKPQKATKTVEVKDNILLREDARTIVSLTIFIANAQQGRIRRSGIIRC